MARPRSGPRSIKVNHAVRPGGKGLDLDQIQVAIKQLTGNETWAFVSPGISPPDFVKTIYSAIESRFPVILLFSIPPPSYHRITRGRALKDLLPAELDLLEKDLLMEHEGHAVALIGHSFTAHNWWSYALQTYFFQPKEIKYLPSIHWVDNFIIQDDNFGPYYFLPTKLVAESAATRELASVLPSAFSAVPLFAREQWLKQKSYAVVIFPPEMEFFKQCLDIEPMAIVLLNIYIQALLAGMKSGSIPITPGDSFSHYFRKYFETNSLILRTVIVSKKDYLEQMKLDHPEVAANFQSHFDSELPEYFWLTEISVPELFWINKRKVGDIITDPARFKNKKEEGVILIKIPEFLFLTTPSIQIFPVPEHSLHYPLIDVSMPFATK